MKHSLYFISKAKMVVFSCKLETYCTSDEMCISIRTEFIYFSAKSTTKKHQCLPVFKLYIT